MLQCLKKVLRVDSERFYKVEMFTDPHTHPPTHTHTHIYTHTHTHTCMHACMHAHMHTHMHTHKHTHTHTDKPTTKNQSLLKKCVLFHMSHLLTCSSYHLPKIYSMKF